MTPDYRAFLQELFAGFGPVRIGRVFNFEGLFLDDTMFGLVADERVFLKADVKSRKAFLKEGSSPLHFPARDGADVAMSYYELPPRLYDEPQAASEWARMAHEVALRSPTATRKQRERVKETAARQPVRRHRRA